MTNIEEKRKLIESRQDELLHELRVLQSFCKHRNATSEPRSDTGNWCKQDDCYWVEHRCPECGKFWREDL